jgi:hypothetical protein
MSMTTLNGHASRTANWHTISVRDFFGQIPWTGAPAPLPTMTPGSSNPGPAAVDFLNLHLSVGDFFNRFPWDGKPNIAAPIAPVEVQPDLPPEDSITLDGFADLF